MDRFVGTHRSGWKVGHKHDRSSAPNIAEYQGQGFEMILLRRPTTFSKKDPQNKVLKLTAGSIRLVPQFVQISLSVRSRTPAAFTYSAAALPIKPSAFTDHSSAPADGSTHDFANDILSHT